MKVAFFCAVFLIINFQCVFAQTRTRSQEQPTDWCQKDTSCTADPTYSYFEKEQLRAYRHVKNGCELLNKILDNSYQEKIYREVDSTLFGKRKTLKSQNSAIQMAKMLGIYPGKIPTCYEDPGTYYYIAKLVLDVDKARKQSHLPLAHPPKFGSLPTPEVNAYTYPADTTEDAVNNRGSIIGFNRQLFMFAYQIPKVVFQSIDEEKETNLGKIGINTSLEHAVKFAEDHPRIKEDFVMAVLEFLGLVDPETPPVNMENANAIINLTEATETFAVAHEFGHLIKNHVLQGSRSLNLSVGTEDATKQEQIDSIYSTVVGTRTWQQELEADDIGFDLLIQVLKNRIKEEKDPFTKKQNEAYFLYDLYGPLLFFKASEITEKAKYLIAHGDIQPVPTPDDKMDIRAIASGNFSKEILDRHPEIDLRSHPPAWLRFERIAKRFRNYVDSSSFNDETLKMATVGKAVIENADMLWGLSQSVFPTLTQAIQDGKMPEKFKYVQCAEYWDYTFLYNPELIKTINLFELMDDNDSIIINNYWQAVKTDWLLLSGRQIYRAKDILMSNDSKRTAVALAIIALTGDKNELPFLKNIATTEWAESDKKILKYAISFLQRNGRSTSLSQLKQLDPKQFDLTKLLAYPESQTFSSSINKLTPLKVSYQAKLYLKNNQAVTKDGSLSAMALYMLISNTNTDVTYSFYADVLLQFGDINSALQYAQAGISKIGMTGDLENIYGNILNQQGDFSGAINHYQNCLKLGRNDGWPEINIAHSYEKLNDTVEAEKWFRNGIARDSTARNGYEYAGYLNDFAWFLQGHFRNDTNKLAESLVYSYASNKITNYTDVNYLDTLIECLIANKEYKSAIKILQLILDQFSVESEDRTKFERRLAEVKKMK